MPEAVIEFLDGMINRYKEVVVNYDNRVVEYWEEGEVIGFSPFEGIMCLSWKKGLPKQTELSGAACYEKQSLRDLYDEKEGGD